MGSNEQKKNTDAWVCEIFLLLLSDVGSPFSVALDGEPTSCQTSDQTNKQKNQKKHKESI